MKKEIEDESIDCIITSPPYDDLRTYGNTCVWNFDVFKNVANELYRILKKGSVLVWVVGDCTKDGDESGTSFKQALYFKEIGFKLGDTMIYEKNGCGACGNNNFYIQNFEYMFVLTKGDIKTHNLLYDRDNINPCGKNVNGNRTKDTCDNGRSYKYYEQKEKGRRFNIWKYNSSEGKLPTP
jgi:site-specific DNA-methyltransferase (adenine-specific)